MPSSTSTSEAAPNSARQPLRFAVFAVLGAMALGVALEVLFRLLPVSTSTATGYYIDPMILTYPAHHRFTVATGWNLQNAQTHVANNLGFVADRDFAPDPNAVALIGDSFVEASMLPSDERLAHQIETRLSGKPVYAMGGPGSSLLDYAERIRYASEKLQVHDFVLLLEHGDMGQALCGSGNVHAQCLDPKTLAPAVERQPPAGKAKQILRTLALPQYLFSQIKLNPAGWPDELRARLRKATPSQESIEERRDSMHVAPEATQRVIDVFFERVKAFPKSHLVLILMGTDEKSQSSDIVLKQLQTAAAQNGATVLTPEPALEKFTAQSGVSMHVSPYDHHLNRIALGSIAAEVAPVLHDAQSAN